MPTVNIPSQIVIQTAAQWAVDATVYSAKRILVTSDVFFIGTAQRKFKIADGVQTWAQLDYVPIDEKAPLYRPVFTDYIDITEIADPANPANTIGRLWASDTNGKTNLNFVGNDGIKQRIGRDIISTVRNVTGSTITKGTIVYVSGATGTAPQVTPARANSQTTLPAVGIAMEDIANNSFGRIQRYGRTEFNFDTSAFAVGATLYVSESVAGTFTTTIPTYPNYPQSVGVVVVSGVGNGSVFVNFITDYNGHSSGTTNTTLTFGATPATSVILANSSTAQRTATFRDASGYVALTDVTQSSITLGVSSTTVGSVVLHNATNANTITIQSGVTSSSHTLTLPVANASGVLTNNGSGTLTWAAASSGITIDSTAITGGGANRILFENSSNQVSESATNFYFQTATPFNHVFAAERTGVITGVANSLFGWSAGKAITTQVRNTYIGYSAGITATGSDGTFIGYNAGNNVGGSFPSYCTAVGSDALSGTLGNQNFTTAIGADAGKSHNGCVSSVFVGYRAGSSATASYYSVFLGQDAGSSISNCFSSIAIGYGAKPTTSHQGVLGSNSADGYVSDWYFNGVTHTAPYSVVLHASHGSGTNVNAANFTISGGAATGTGNGGFVKSTTSVKRASGTTLQVDTDRNVIVGKYVDITGGAATTFGQLALATSGTVAGGIVVYTIEANDGTDYQSLSGTLRYDVVNKAGTLTVVYSDTQNGTGACSTGTLTATVTATTSGTNVLFQANAVSDLSETVLRVSFQVLNQFGQATITAA